MRNSFLRQVGDIGCHKTSVHPCVRKKRTKFREWAVQKASRLKLARELKGAKRAAVAQALLPLFLVTPRFKICKGIKLGNWLESPNGKPQRHQQKNSD